jgi:hypothetical protein
MHLCDAAVLTRFVEDGSRGRIVITRLDGIISCESCRGRIRRVNNFDGAKYSAQTNRASATMISQLPQVELAPANLDVVGHEPVNTE